MATELETTCVRMMRNMRNMRAHLLGAHMHVEGVLQLMALELHDIVKQNARLAAEQG